MQELSTEVKSEWLSMEEASSLKGVTKSALSHALNLRPEIKQRYTKRVGKKLYITKEGYMVLFNVQNQAQGGLKKNECALNDVSPIKQQIAEFGVEAMKDPIIVMRLEQMRLAEQVESLVRFKEQFQPMLEDTTPIDITASQRQFLNERVRNLAIKSGLPFSHIWGLVHDKVGKRPLEAYAFEDYPVAIKFLKSVHEAHQLDW